MAKRPVPIFPAMVVAIPLVIGIAAISTSHQSGQRHERDQVLAASPDFVAAPIFGADDCVLDGVDQSFVVVGSSDSFAWPEMLQDMLDEHAGDRRRYWVYNAASASAPVKAWTSDERSHDYEMSFGAMLRDFFGDDPRLRGVAPQPSIALCQQTLQTTRTPRGPVASMGDKDGIRIGADALERMATRLHAEGVERVYIAMHFHKDGAEPEVGNERLALRNVLDRELDFIFEGPDVWSATTAVFPAAFEEDHIHLNQRGLKLLAEAWYRTLAGSQASQAIIDRMHARNYDVESIIRKHLTSRVPG